MFAFEKVELPVLGLRGLEADLSEEEKAIQENVHRFARDVMRPIGKKLDGMSPEEVIAEGSPITRLYGANSCQRDLGFGRARQYEQSGKKSYFPYYF